MITQTHRVSQRVATVPPSGIRKFFDIVATMKDVISLGIGEPDFSTPEDISQAGILSIQQGITGYTSNSGLIELRQAVSDHLAALYGHLRTNLLTVKPGLSGLWQISGRSDVSYEERIQLDMHYIRNYTIWQDLRILFVQTVPAVLKGRGAY